MKKVYDLIVYGGSITGCLTAVMAAKRGKSVVLVEKKTFLGDNVTSGLYTGCEEENNAVIKFKLLETMEKYNVEVLFMSDLTAVAVNDDCVKGVLVSNRFGQQLIYARAVVDTTGFDRVTEMCDDVNLWNYNGKCEFCIKYFGTEISEINESEIPENVEIIKSFDGGYFARFSFEVNSGKDRYSDLVNWNSKATLLCDEIDSKLKMFKDLRMIQASYEVNLPDVAKHSSKSKIYKNVKAFYYPDFSDTEGCIKYVSEELDKLIFDNSDDDAQFLKSRNIVIPVSECSIVPFDDFKMSVKSFEVKYDYEKFLPVLDSASVLVAGGGTAGFASAIGAAEETENVAVIDENTGFGGTQTYGSVCRYYHGYIKGFSEMQEKILEKFSPVYKRVSYLKQISDKKIKQHTGVCVCGAVCGENEIKGVVIANSDVWGIIKSEITIDGTGNADIIAFAGVETTSGALRDGNLQDYSQSVIERSGLDLDVIDHSKYSEMLRGIKLAHSQYQLGDFSTMLTPRATRCFKGDYTVTIKDILFEKSYDDCISIAHTDSDAHGALNSDMHFMGYVPYHDKVFTLETPLSACIPKDFKRLIAVGKSLSATSDAVGFFRMAADIINRGYATGIAAAMAVGKDIRDIDYLKLKEKLISKDILPKELIKEEIPENDETKLLKIICQENPDLNSIKSEYEKTKSDALAIALGWFGEDVGCKQLTKRLKELLEKEKNEYYSDVHPWKPGNNKGGVMGEAEIYWQINRIILTFARAGWKNCSEEILNALNAFDGGGSTVRDDTPYVYGRIDLQRLPHFDRIRVLCRYIETCPDTKYVEALEKLLKEKGLGGFATTENIIARDYQNAYVELTISRTLARCGSKYGAEKLCEFLGDVHYIFSENAHKELLAITGKDFGYDKNQWEAYISEDYKPEIVPYIYKNNMY